MREQQSFSDGSVVDLGQGAIGPSLEDIARFKNPSEPSPSLRNTHGRNSSLAGTTAVAASVIFAPTPAGDISFQAPNGEYCTIKFKSLPEDFTNEDLIGFQVEFTPPGDASTDPNNKSWEHRVIVKNSYGQIINLDSSKYTNEQLITGTTINEHLSDGTYTMEVREKAVDLIFGDEGKSCEVDIRIGENGGPLDENGNPILPDIQIAVARSMEEIYKEFFAEFNNKPPFEYDPSSLGNPDLKDTWYQCVDIVYAFADRLGIPVETLRHIFAKDFLIPNPTTSDFWEIIEYKEGEKMEFKTGDIGVWGQPLGKFTDENGATQFAGHTAIIVGRGDGDKLITFGQNYPIGSNAHLQEISLNGFKGVLRAEGFGPGGEAPKATEKPDPNAKRKDIQRRIESLLAIEPGDSDQEIAKKTALSTWFNALNSKQEGEDITLNTAILNLDDWEANFQRFFEGETIESDPLEVGFEVNDNGKFMYAAIIEIDDLKFWIWDDSDTIREIDRKNGLEKRFIVVIDSTERAGQSEWSESRVEMYIFFEDGKWTNGGVWINGSDEQLRYMRRYGGWDGINLFSKLIFS